MTTPGERPGRTLPPPGLRRPRPLLLAGGCVVTMDPDRRVLPKADLLLSGGRITAVGERIALPPGVTTLDCSGCLVLPGFVQAHVHLCQTLARGRADDAALLDWLRGAIWPYEAALDGASAAAAAALGGAELLLGGTTAILDMGTVRWQDEIFSVCERVGLRVTSGKAMMDKGEGVPASLRERTADSLRDAAALAKRWHGAAGGRLRYAYAPRFVLSCTEELLREAAAAARAGGMLLHTHASENPEECAAVRAETGADNVEALGRLGLLGRDVVLAHGVWLSERERALIAESETSIVHCPSANLKLASGIAPVPELRAAGVRVALGADGAACNNNLDVFCEMRLSALVHRPRGGPRALSARTAVEMATLGGAQALGLEAEIGSLEPGKRADACVVEAGGLHQAPLGPADPYATLVFASGARDVRDVVIGGEVVVRDRTLLTLDRHEVLTRARAAARRLFGKD